MKYAHVFPPLDTTLLKSPCAFDTSSSRTLKKSHTTRFVAMLVQNTELDLKPQSNPNSKRNFQPNPNPLPNVNPNAKPNAKLNSKHNPIYNPNPKPIANY